MKKKYIYTFLIYNENDFGKLIDSVIWLIDNVLSQYSISAILFYFPSQIIIILPSSWIPFNSRLIFFIILFSHSIYLLLLKSIKLISLMRYQIMALYFIFIIFIIFKYIFYLFFKIKFNKVFMDVMEYSDDESNVPLQRQKIKKLRKNRR